MSIDLKENEVMGNETGLALLPFIEPAAKEDGAEKMFLPVAVAMSSRPISQASIPMRWIGFRVYTRRPPSWPIPQRPVVPKGYDYSRYFSKEREPTKLKRKLAETLGETIQHYPRTLSQVLSESLDFTLDDPTIDSIVPLSAPPPVNGDSADFSAEKRFEEKIKAIRAGRNSILPPSSIKTYARQTAVLSSPSKPEITETSLPTISKKAPEVIEVLRPRKEDPMTKAEIMRKRQEEKRYKARVKIIGVVRKISQDLKELDSGFRQLEKSLSR